MITKIITNIQNQMKPFLNQGQFLKLTKTLLSCFKDVQIVSNECIFSEKSNADLLQLFLSAKQVEGCSKKTLVYYKSTIEKMF